MQVHRLATNHKIYSEKYRAFLTERMKETYSEEMLGRVSANVDLSGHDSVKELKSEDDYLSYFKVSDNVFKSLASVRNVPSNRALWQVIFDKAIKQKQLISSNQAQFEAILSNLAK